MSPADAGSPAAGGMSPADAGSRAAGNHAALAGPRQRAAGRKEPGLLVLSDGSVFRGEVLGAASENGITTGELVFNTTMTGYQEVITDPSYAGQIVTFTYPHIGNYGVTPADDESPRPRCLGVITREMTPSPSNWRAREPLEVFLLRHGIPAMTGVDTRRLTRVLRDHGALPCAFGTADEAALSESAASAHGTDGMDLASAVSTREVYTVGSGTWRVVAYDFGIKQTMLEQLARFASVQVVPASTTAAEVLSMSPDGVVLSNGPGDPSALDWAVDAVSDLVGAVPLLGICLGHQLLGRALGGTTYKLPFGHHGGNHPVKDLGTGHVEITSQNHNYALRGDSLPRAEITHVNLNDGVLEGFKVGAARAIGIQYHPEAGPGPHDARYLFESFRSLMGSHR